MNTIDVIILSYAKDENIIKMNNDCINSLLNSTTNYNFNIILVETDDSKHIYEQKEVTVLQPNLKFNYNKFLNIGSKECKNDWVLISNNDTLYHKNFLEKMFEAHNYDNEILSMSPMDDDWHLHKNIDKNIQIYYGHRVPYEITGWSIFLHKSVLKKIGDFDEQFDFWYQDNDYSNSLIKNKIKHALITNSKVTHLVSQSHELIQSENRFNMTYGSVNKFNNKWK